MISRLPRADVWWPWSWLMGGCGLSGGGAGGEGGSCRLLLLFWSFSESGIGSRKFRHAWPAQVWISGFGCRYRERCIAAQRLGSGSQTRMRQPSTKILISFRKQPAAFLSAAFIHHQGAAVQSQPTRPRLCHVWRRSDISAQSAPRPADVRGRVTLFPRVTNTGVEK